MLMASVLIMASHQELGYGFKEKIYQDDPPTPKTKRGKFKRRNRRGKK